MAAKVGVPPEEDIALPTIASPKHHDYAHKLPNLTVDDEIVNEATHADSDSSEGSATDSGDDFDWDEEDETMTRKEKEAHASKAKRFRFLWMAFMKLSRPIRVLIIGILGCGALIAPLLVFQFRFHDSVARPQVHVWSLWLAIVWATSCVTYLAVDLIPKLFISLVVMLGYKVERLRIQIEVSSLYTPALGCLLTRVPYTAHLRYLRLAEVGIGRIVGMDRSFSHSLCLQPLRLVLDHHQPRYAGVPIFCTWYLFFFVADITSS